MSIVKMLQAIKLAELSGLKVEVVEYDHGDLLVQVYPPPVGDDYVWSYSDNFPPDDVKGVTEFILKVVEEDNLHNNINQ